MSLKSTRKGTSKDLVVHLDELRAISKAELEKILEKLLSETGLMDLTPIIQSTPQCWIEAMLLLEQMLLLETMLLLERSCNFASAEARKY